MRFLPQGRRRDSYRATLCPEMLLRKQNSSVWRHKPPRDECWLQHRIPLEPLGLGSSPGLSPPTPEGTRLCHCLRNHRTKGKGHQQHPALQHLPFVLQCCHVRQVVGFLSIKEGNNKTKASSSPEEIHTVGNTYCNRLYNGSYFQDTIHQAPVLIP